MTHILVVDDHAEFLPVLASMLAYLEHDAVTAENGATALQQRTRPDLILLDIQMPELNGVELAKKLRSRWPKLPVVFMTAGCEPKLRSEAEQLGPVLDKPLRTLRLKSVIEEALARPAER